MPERGIYRDSKYRHPHLGFVGPSIADFRSVYRKLGGNQPVYLCLAVLIKTGKFGVLLIDTLDKPREYRRMRRRRWSAFYVVGTLW